MTNEKRKRRTSTEIQKKIIDLFKSGERINAISKKLKMDYKTVSSILKENGFETKGKQYRKYPIIEDFFENIDTPNKAYFLGLLYTDGYAHCNGRSVAIQLQLCDKEILEKLNNLLQPTKPITICRRTSVKHADRCILSMESTKLHSDIVRHGCIPNKTYILKWPEFLDENLWPHFIRGMMDGDGCLWQNMANFTGTEALCIKLQEIFKNKFNLHSKITNRWPESGNNIRTLVLSCGVNLIRALDWIYDGAEMYMERKFKKYEFIKNPPKITSHLNAVNEDGSKMTSTEKQALKRKLFTAEWNKLNDDLPPNSLDENVRERGESRPNRNVIPKPRP